MSELLTLHAAPARCLLEWSLGIRGGSRRDFSLSVSDAHAHKSTQECPALPSPITLCQSASAICACPAFCSRRNSSKARQDGSPRWRCYDSRGRGGCWETHRAFVRLVLATAIPTPPRQWDGRRRMPQHDLHPPCPTSSRRSCWWLF